MIEYLLVLALFGAFGWYVYSAITAGAASNVVGAITAGTSGVTGVLLTGYTDTIAYIKGAAAGTLGFSGYLLVMGLLAMALVMLYNGFRTANHDVTLVR